jgi:2-polyprenyl-6-methoxyphenol hydroxylase-like FAD-dependent oxidoreductase
MRIGIVGAGIGGLTAAAALGRSHEVVLFERAERFGAVGAGIVLAANAADCLRSVGVDLRGVAHQLGRSELRDGGGRVLQRLDLSAGSGPSFAISRPALHAHLARVVEEVGVDVRLGSHVTGAEPGPVVELADGGSEDLDLVVGADGIHSTARRALPDPGRLRYSGSTCWRAILPVPGMDTMFESWARSTRIGSVPLGGGRIYTFLVAVAPEGAPGPATLGELRQMFSGQGDDVSPILDALDRVPDLHHDLSELDRPVWGEDRVVLIGDAAHAMTPNLGQGAAMAIEDAVVLADEIAAGPSGLIERFRQRRYRRVRRMQGSSRRVGRMAALRRPATRRLGNALVASTPGWIARRQLEWVTTGPCRPAPTTS